MARRSVDHSDTSHCDTRRRAQDRYSLTEEQAFVLANPDGAVHAPGAFVLALGALRAEERIAGAFRSGAGLGWHEHDESVFTGCEQFFRPATPPTSFPPRRLVTEAGFTRFRRAAETPFNLVSSHS